MEEKNITGTEAVNRMRKLKLIPGATFSIRFITCDFSRSEYGQVRLYERCRLRTGGKNEGLSIDCDHYLFFTDEDTDEPRKCFKWLVRAVSFPPSYEWHQVKWFL